LSTVTNFYARTEWVASLTGDCPPEQLAQRPAGRVALAATNQAAFRTAVAELAAAWAAGPGSAHAPDHPDPAYAGPLPFPDDVIRYADGAVRLTHGGTPVTNPHTPTGPEPRASTTPTPAPAAAGGGFVVIVTHPGQTTALGPFADYPGVWAWLAGRPAEAYGATSLTIAPLRTPEPLATSESSPR
jgi:hypothetical protein